MASPTAPAVTPTACLALADGTVFRIPACIVATMAGGLVVTVNEYLDSAAARPLMEAFAAKA